MMHSLWLITFYCVIQSFSGLGESTIVVHYEEYAIQEFSDTELPFAAPIPLAGIKGVIINADPPDACSNITSPPNLNNSLNWFVLIAGSSCDYETKLVYSELAGYSAAVIYNVIGQWHGMYTSRSRYLASNPNISAVSIPYTSGIKIKESYLFTVSSRFSVMLTSNFAYSKWSSTLQKYHLLFICTAFLIFSFAVPLGIIKFVQQVRSLHINRLSSRHLRQLQTTVFQKGDPYETCAVCLEDYKDKDELRILPCLHGYHARCIDPWLLNNRCICPVCKQKVVLSSNTATNEFECDTEGRTAATPLLSSRNGRHAAHGTFSTSPI
ncbi:E3 ubiquitin-protein ligase RNF13-like isoform X1 [Stegodyphus dumicola]|uniref:E3 ubiquitin-protein ligase RNF13-like isoform X1 n=1 Tax=Stegodyphus dumicola TaxID=202533 RepID=UPI0015B206C4|nr:E3 ubiquitin-protein ligase RNF13-like isoform X1 [Stegodyphus dumicola]XP_035215035.1 E3 ubiquitin-protein ligase RNF13-like isoform X1 [Stegodyphus dumicola]XP_035215037.1 E3 ubiquitin-protein ligase RNF13-like isoform X1 [Stegodyphus dumicola]XP_035215038.1 E3 ubiquitin-protein ligase RNF13-like isoform X1 [Stegodyphus dumicola]XP_035215039.1 E3 ubiquitin-protein ligase RNF13-like isoform X1 [Stegodyphus dumicola]